MKTSSYLHISLFLFLLCSCGNNEKTGSTLTRIDFKGVIGIEFIYGLPSIQLGIDELTFRNMHQLSLADAFPADYEDTLNRGYLLQDEIIRAKDTIAINRWFRFNNSRLGSVELSFFSSDPNTSLASFNAIKRLDFLNGLAPQKKYSISRQDYQLTFSTYPIVLSTRKQQTIEYKIEVFAAK